MRPSRLVVLLLWLLGLNPAGAAPVTGSKTEEEHPALLTLQGERRPTSVQVAQVWEASVVGRDLLVLDGVNHQLGVHRSGSDWSFVGSIGNGPGEFFYPTEMAVDAAIGRVAVFDGGNSRIQILELSSGDVTTKEVIHGVYGLSWWQGNSLLLGRPETGSLLTVLDPSRGFVGDLGELVTPAELSRFDAGIRSTFLTAVNRTRTATTRSGDVWVAFTHLPLLRRYGPKGELLWERSLDLRGVGELGAYAESVWDPEDQPSSAAYMNIDGVQLPLIIKDIGVDAASGQPLLLLGNSSLAFLKDDGRVHAVAEITGCASSFDRIAIDPSRAVVLLASLVESALCEIPLDQLMAYVPPTAESDTSADR